MRSPGDVVEIAKVAEVGNEVLPVGDTHHDRVNKVEKPHEGDLERRRIRWRR